MERQAGLSKLHGAKLHGMVAEATVQVLQAAEMTGKKDNLSRVVLVRVLRALTSILQHTNQLESKLESAASASSDYEVLLNLLELPEVQAALGKTDPLAPAAVRGLRAVDELIQAEGGCASGEKAAEILGMSRQAVDKARKESRLLALPRGQNRYIYPVWQFDRGKILPGLKDVYRQLPSMGPWAVASFMLSANTKLKDASPLDKLRSGDVESVIAAARAYGEHGAD
ncbi:MAG: hypothetical protein K2X29_05760 [Candidatus Obscuribacterales bacterium]|nr:hypothetical protein [Candidatus Obscuribacterales bacterium]